MQNKDLRAGISDSDREQAEALFLEHLPTIERVAERAARRSRLREQDVEDFVSWVRLRILEDDYGVIRKFRGQSSLKTYLISVVNFRLRDYRNHLLGKFRPSARAKKKGPLAERLETLLARDGMEFEQAVAVLLAREDVSASAEEIRILASELRIKPRRRFVGEEALDFAESGDRADRGAEDSERHRTARRTRETLDEALRVLPAEDLLLLKLHYKSGMSVARIARHLRLEQRPLYGRKSRAVEDLKSTFARRGLGWEEVRDILGWRELDLTVPFGRDDPDGNPPTRERRP